MLLIALTFRSVVLILITDVVEVVVSFSFFIPNNICCLYCYILH